ncbi:MAG: redoxin domain-containing protein [Marinoscillum sp.]
MKILRFSSLLLVFIIHFLNANAQSVGDPAPDFTLDLVDGGEFTLSNYEGKVVFIFFFGYACPHCISNGPNTESGINEVYKSNPDFVAIGVDTWDGNTSGVNSFRSSTNITYPLALRGSGVQSDYKTTYDRIVIVDKDGIIRYKSSANATNSVVSTASNVVSKYLELDASGGGGGNGGSNVLGSNHSTREELMMFPNPANRYLIVKSPIQTKLNCEIEILDLSGKRTFQSKAMTNADGEITIPMIQQAEGIHFLVVSYTNGISYKEPFIIAR